MTRVKTGITRKTRHKKVRKLTKGYRMTRGRLYKVSKEALLHADQYSFAGRKDRKHDFRTLWITRINAGLNGTGIKYSAFISKLKKTKINLNRKMLSELATIQPHVFKQIVDHVK